MAVPFKQNFVEGVNLDFDETKVKQTQAMFIKNMTANANANANTPVGAGANIGVYTPLESNTLLPVTLPSGTNYCVGFYSSETTNEGYACIYNSGNQHLILLINGETGAISTVYMGALLPFVLDPQYFFTDGRIVLVRRSYIDKATGLENEFKFLVFTNNLKNQFCISVDDSIATASFSTGYFTGSSAFYDPLELIHLGVPTPLKNIGLDTPTAYSPTIADPTIQNILVRNGWQFRIKFIDIFGRESEHGIISDQYITIIGGGCISTSNGLPRCVMLNFDAGNPLVNQIQVEYRQWVGDDRAGALATNWLTYEIFNKYDNSAAVKWYARSINPLFSTSGSGITFNSGTNTIAYTFCGDKNSVPIDPIETARVQPDLPRISASVFEANKGLGLANNVRGFEQLAPSLVNKVSFGVELPNPANTPCAAPPTRTIIVYANIYNPYDDADTLIRASYGKVVFGNADHDDCSGGSTPTRHSTSFKLGQVFGDQTNPGFIGYLAGTPYKCISEQGDFDVATGAFVFQGYGPGISFPHSIMQRFTFTDVPAGNYIFRIASHKSTVDSPDYQKTSTYVAAAIPFFDLSIPGNRRTNMAQFPSKELLINVTTSDYGTVYSNSDLMVLILDLGGNTYNRAGAVDGYLYETVGGAPIEMAPIEIGGLSSIGTSIDGYGSFFTDHNGFYFVATYGKPMAAIWLDLCDGAGLTNVLTMFGNPCSIQHGNGVGSIPGHCWGDDGDWTLNGAIAPVATYPAAARRVIKQKITTCSNPNIGVPGVPGIMSRGAVGLSNGSGMITLVAHNRYAYSFPGHTTPYLGSLVPNYSTSPNNRDILVLSQKGGCTWNDCSNCNTYIIFPVITYIACGGSSSGCTGTQPPRTLCLADLTVKVTGVGLYGVQTGGKYPVSFILWDRIGRCTAPQVRQGASAFVTMPNLNDVGYQVFALPRINFTIDPTTVFPLEFTKMTLQVGANVLFSDYISLGADWVQPIDSTGETNSVNPVAMRIYYGSLNEYNKTNDYSTNTGWEFIKAGDTNRSPVEGDIAQFIMNGDGAWLPSVISAAISYDKEGLFFTIPYLPELAGLKNNCLFRVIRPVKNQSGEFAPLYEQSLTIPIVAGVPQILSGVVPYFDSYLLTRLIPVPRMKGMAGPISPAAFPITPSPIQYTSSNQDATLDTSGYSTSNVNNANGVVIFQVTDDPVSYPFLFESPSPADTWGSHLACRGRVFFPNPTARQHRSDTEIAMSDQVSDRGVLNAMSYFELNNVVTFDRNSWGGIQAVLVETSTCLVITDSGHFVINFGGSNLKTDRAGNVIAQNTYGMFTSPERKAGTGYGCDPRDINTIRKYAGKVCWLDRSGYVVFHDFHVAKAVQYNGYDAYINNKIAKVNLLNENPGANGLTYFIGGINPKTWEYCLSSFNIPASGSPSYLNQLSDVNLAVNETLILDLETGVLKCMPSFTPEYYGMLPAYYLQKNMLTFKGGKPYIHYNGPAGASANRNVFYGTQCKKWIVLCVNPGSEKVKRFLWNEVYCKEHKFIATTITTEKGQLSRLLNEQWDFREKFWTAAFLCDLNTPADPNLPIQTGANVILDGNNLGGRWMKVYYSSLDADDPLYCEISGIDNYVIGIEPSAD